MTEYVFITNEAIFFEKENKVFRLLRKNSKVKIGRVKTISLDSFRDWKEIYPNDIRIEAASIEEAMAIHDLLI